MKNKSGKEVVSINGQFYEIIDHETCLGCSFELDNNGCSSPAWVTCSLSFHPDGRSVIFKLIENEKDN